MEPRSTARTRLRIRRIAEPGLNNSYRTQASKASVMLIAAKADHELLLYIGGKLHLILAE
jgi:hypothetical protein